MTESIKRNIKILLLEDDRAEQQLVKEFLTKDPLTKFEVVCIENLDKASGLLSGEEHLIDVIIADLGLPDSQGLDTVKELLMEAPYVPVVVLTGHEDSEQGIKAIQLGAQDYINKESLDPFILSRIIRYSVESK